VSDGWLTPSEQFSSNIMAMALAHPDQMK